MTEFDHNKYDQNTVFAKMTAILEGTFGRGTLDFGLSCTLDLFS